VRANVAANPSANTTSDSAPAAARNALGTPMRRLTEASAMRTLSGRDTTELRVLLTRANTRDLYFNGTPSPALFVQA